MKNKGLQYSLFWGTIILLGIGYYILCYYQMRFGDDILFPFYKGFRHYLDNSGWEAGERVRTLGMALEQYKEYYLNFSGRLPAFFQGLSFNLLGERMVSILSAAVYTGTIALICRIGLKSGKKVMKAPAILLLCSVYMYWLTPTGTYIAMWTFVCQYGIPVLAFLLYYLIVSKSYYLDEISVRRKTAIAFFGFFCGWCHECLGLFLILLVGIKAVVGAYIKKDMSIKRLWLNSGLVLGWCVILAAPGNYKRLFLDHDIARASTGMLEKITVSIYEHLISAGVLTRMEIWMPLLFFALGVISFIKKREKIASFILDNLEWLVVIFLSVPVWAVFAPPVPQYGLQLWKACVIILLLRAIDVEVLGQKAWNTVAVVGLVLMITLNQGWLTDLVRVTQNRRSELVRGLELNQETIYVERYPETTNNYLTLYNYANNDEFSSDLAYQFYGIRMIVKE